MREPPRIVDLVFAGEPKSGGRRQAFGTLIVVALYAGGLAAVGQLGRRERSRGAQEAVRVPDRNAVERVIDVAAPAARPDPATKPGPALHEHRIARASRAQRGQPAAPARAGQLAVVMPPPVAVAESGFAAGSGSTYTGGATTSAGSGRAPASGPVAPGGRGDGGSGGRDRARPVSLDQAAWNCPWPLEADAEQVDEQTVILRVTVRPDGRAERVDVLSDPGFGFGAAARRCALRTAFVPARDRAGQAIAAPSPPIRVHFFR